MKKARAKLIALGLSAVSLLSVLGGCQREQTGNTLFRSSMLACAYGVHYGYDNRKWETAINPVYDYAYNFDEFNVARVRQYGKWGLINTHGTYVVEPLYDYIGPFSENGLAPFITDELVGYLTVSGQIIIPAQFPADKGVFGFNSNGLCVFYQNGSYGLINEFGQIVMDAKFESINDTLWSMNLCAAQKDGKYALYSTSFSAITGFIFESVACGGEKTVIGKLNGLYHYYNTDGSLLFEAGFEEAFPFAENGLALVREDGLYGFINRDGRYELEARFTDASVFSANGLALVRNTEGLYGYINRSGEYVIAAKYLSGSDFVSNSACNLNLAVVETEKGFGVINDSGRMLVRPNAAYSGMTLSVYDDDIFVGVTETGVTLFKRNGKVLRVFAPGGINPDK